MRRDATTLARDLQGRVNAGLPPNAAQVGRSLPDRYVVIKQYSVGRITVGIVPPRGDTIVGQAFTRDFSVTVEADDSVRRLPGDPGAAGDQRARAARGRPSPWCWRSCRPGG